MGVLAELRRRRVLRTAAIYAVAAWGLQQLAGVVQPSLGLPAWGVSLVLFLLVLGFPVAMVLAWAFDLEPGGVVRTAPGARPGPGAKLGYLLLLIAGTGLLAWLLTRHWTHVGPAFEPHPHSVEALAEPRGDKGPERSSERRP